MFFIDLYMQTLSLSLLIMTTRDVNDAEPRLSFSEKKRARAEPRL